MADDPVDPIQATEPDNSPDPTTAPISVPPDLAGHAPGGGLFRRLILLFVGGIFALCLCALAGAGYWYLANRDQVDRVISALTTPTPAAVRPSTSPVPSGSPTPRPAPAVREQWASSATASSAFSSPDFSPLQAAGQPNTTRCADLPTAWASGKKNKQEWLLVTFSVPVRATKIVVHQTHKPGNVVRVDLREQNGEFHTIFQGKDPTTACPGQFSPPFQPTTFLVNGIRIWVEDPPDDWAEIDAVQLIGTEATP